jgi:hypothetical protein
MPRLFIDFNGICTHLVTNHSHPEAPQVELWTGRELIQHRIFLANSDLIGSHIDPKRPILPHVPRMIVHPDYVTPSLEPMLDRKGDRYEHVLKDEAIAFAKVDLNGGSPSHEDALKLFPRIWDKSKPDYAVHLRPRLLSGLWTRHASAYIDFTGGVDFQSLHSQHLQATVYFTGTPTIVFRPRNGDKGAVHCELGDEARIVISNVPEGSGCNDSDYLLHYLATTLDLCEDAPVWPPPESGLNDVYCSSSTYP